MNRKSEHTFVLVCLFLCAFVCVWSSAFADSTNAEDTAFHFVQITDTHFGSRDYAARTTLLRKNINDLSIPVACVVHTGDIWMDNLHKPGIVEEGLELLRGFKAPVHVVPGNHDIMEKKIEDTLAVYTNRVGPLFSQTEYNGVVFMFVFVEPLANGYTVPDFDPLAVTSSKLKAANGRPVIIFQHTPPVDSFHKNRMHRSWIPDAREKWISLINSHNVRAVISGHLHRDEFHWLGKVPLYVAAPIVGYWGRQASYRIYEYRNGLVSYRSQYGD